MFYTTNMNFIVSNKPIIKKFVSARTSIFRGQADTLARLYAGVSYAYDSGINVTNNGQLNFKGGLPWGLLYKASCGFEPIVVLAGTPDSTTPVKATKLSKGNAGANISADALPSNYYNCLQLINPSLVLDISQAFTFWLYIVATGALNATPGTNILANLNATDSFQAAKDEDYICLPDLVTLLKEFLPKACSKFNENPCFVGVNCAEIATDCDYYISDKCFSRLKKLKYIKQKTNYNLQNLCCGEFSSKFNLNTIALQILNAIAFILAKTTITSSNYYILNNRTIKDIKSFSTTAENKTILVHCCPSDNTLQHYITDKTNGGTAINIVTVCQSPVTDLTSNQLQTFKDVNLQLAKIEHLTATAELAPAFGHIMRKFIFRQTPSLFSGRMPRFISQNLHAICSRLSSDSGKLKSLADLALKQGDWAASVALERIAQKQLGDACDCMQYLYGTDDFQTCMIELIENQKSLISSCGSLTGLAKLHNLESVASTANLIRSHTNSQLDILTNLCVSANTKR